MLELSTYMEYFVKHVVETDTKAIAIQKIIRDSNTAPRSRNASKLIPFLFDCLIASPQSAQRIGVNVTYQNSCEQIGPVRFQDVSNL